MICALMLLAAGTAAADKTNIVLRSGESITNATISRVEPDGVTLIYGSTIRKYAFPDLPGDMQQHFKYNPTNAAAYTAKMTSGRQNRAQKVKAAQAKADSEAAAEQAEADRRAAESQAAENEARKKALQRESDLLTHPGTSGY